MFFFYINSTLHDDVKLATFCHINLYEVISAQKNGENERGFTFQCNDHKKFIKKIQREKFLRAIRELTIN